VPCGRKRKLKKIATHKRKKKKRKNDIRPLCGAGKGAVPAGSAVFFLLFHSEAVHKPCPNIDILQLGAPIL
jgi:hypothetical protein